MLNGTIWPDDEGEEITFADVDFLSFVSSPGGAHAGTFGKPPIIAPGTDDFVAAVRRDGNVPVTVLYVNPANIAAMKVTKTP